MDIKYEQWYVSHKSISFAEVCMCDLLCYFNGFSNLYVNCLIATAQAMLCFTDILRGTKSDWRNV